MKGEIKVVASQVETRLKKFSPRPRGKSVIGIFLAINKYVSINDRNCKNESEQVFIFLSS